MSVTTSGLLEAVAIKRQQSAEDRNKRWQRLVMACSKGEWPDGREVAPEEVEIELDALGKSVEELDSEMKRIEPRAEWKKQVAAGEAAQAEKLKAGQRFSELIARRDAYLKSLEPEFQEVAELGRSLDLLIRTADDARQRLGNTCADPAIVDRIEELEEERIPLSRKLQSLMTRINEIRQDLAHNERIAENPDNSNELEWNDGVCASQRGDIDRFGSEADELRQRIALIEQEQSSLRAQKLTSDF